tara:strand:- start:200 stop:988 length:789 start_codon:yes stop_codon:yes gene_type:complete
MFIDTHCHAGINWFEPIENLIFQMDMNSVEKSVLIQHKGSSNDYLYQCQKKYPGKFSVVAAVDWDLPLEDQLNEFKLRGVSGVRIYLDYNQIFENKGNDFFENCSKNNLLVSLASDLKTFSSFSFKNLVERNKETIFIIEHLAGVGSSELENDNLNKKNKFKQVLNLSENKNLFMKVPGLGELNERPNLLSNNFPFKNDNSGYIKQTLESFSSEYLMWGSDYPPVSNREGYKNSFRGVFDLSFLSNKDKENIFENVPKKLFF